MANLLGYVVRPAMALTALVALCQLDRPALDATADGWRLLREPARRQPDRQYETMRQQFIREVPAGSTVFVEMHFADVWRVRIMEFASQHGAYVAATPQSADFTASVRYDAGLPHDPDAQLIIEPLR